MKKTVAVAVLLVMCLAVAQAEDSEKHPRLITVTGVAEVHAAPDQAVIQIGVESRDKDLTAAKADHDARMKAVLRAVHEAGIEERDVSTSQMSMQPEFQDNRWRTTPSGYEVSQSVCITLKNLAKFDHLMTELLMAGTNRVENVRFGIADRSKLRAEARTKAIVAAKEKAASMAAQLEQTLGKPWEIAEADSEWPAMLQNANAFGYNGAQVNASDSTVSPGEVTIREQVRVSFELQ